jgi:hypothetical protein
MHPDVLIRRLRSLQVGGDLSLRRLFSTGFPKKLAEKLILTNQNKEACHQRRRNARVQMFHYMVCRLPQRIFNTCQPPRQNYAALFKISANMGCCDAAIYIGLSCMHTDCEIALNYFEIAASQGNTEAQYYLGKMLLESDRTKATKLLTDAAIKGDMHSQFLLGNIHGNTEEGIGWYASAAGKGHTEAQYLLGWHFKSSNKLDDAVSWFRLAALSNHYWSKVDLFEILENHPKLRKEEESRFFIDNSHFHNPTLRRRWLERK